MNQPAPPSTHCDNCAPEFGCFDGSNPCCKVPPSITPFADSHFADLVKERDQLRAELSEASKKLEVDKHNREMWSNCIKGWTDLCNDHDQLKSTLAQLEKDHDEETGEFQNDVKKLLDKLTGSNVDGAGCDSGDWRDFTLTEIKQGVSQLQSQLSVLRKDKDKMLMDYSSFVAAMCGAFCGLTMHPTDVHLNGHLISPPSMEKLKSVYQQVLKERTTIDTAIKESK